VTTTDVAGGDVYYSVGTNGADLKTGLPTLSIASGTATLTVAQTGNIGVGDEIDYDTGNKIAYIKSVISQTQFLVHTATGGVPGNVTSVTVNAIRRAFNTLASAEANSGDASHLTTFDLTATGAAANLTWVAYADADFTAGATINGYTTDATHFITLTAAGSSQVASGTSQRHNGTAGTGVVLDGQNLVGGVLVNDDYTQIEWFEIIRTGGANGRAAATAQDATNVIFDHLLIHNYTTGLASYGIKGADNSTFTVRNCIIYDGQSSGIRLSGLTSTGIVQNCTVYGITGTGISKDDGTVTVTNSISMGNTTDFSGGTQSYNLSSDATATGTGSLINKVAADQFVNITASSEDLHLKAGADAIDTGTDLSGSFADDIDGDARPIGAQWDIGADETNAGASLTPLGSYCFNEAGSGTGPTTVLDGQANPVNLSVSYGTGMAWFTHAGGHLGLNAATDPHTGIATGVANGTKYSTNLDGATQATFTAVADWLPAVDTQRIGGFFRLGTNPSAYLMVNTDGSVFVRVMTGAGETSVNWSTPYEDGVRRVFHAVFDSDHATASSRIRLYVNGVDQGAGTVTNGAWPTLGAGLDFNTADLDLSFLNEPNLTKPLHGTVYYYAVYAGELTDPEILSNASALLADDDCGSTPAVTSAVAEISPNDVTTSSTGIGFSYDIQTTIGGGDTGVDTVAITVPGTFTVAA
jgi:hypothetical protein